MRAVPVLLAAVLALPACSGGRDCDGLPASTAGRDAARADYLALVREQQAGGPATLADLERADDVLHDVERAHAELDAACGDRPAP